MDTDMRTDVYSRPDGNEAAIGAELIARGRAQEALKLLTIAVNRNPNDGLASYNAGVACYSLKQFEQAESHFKKAIRCFPDFIEAHHNLGQARAAQSKPRQAMAAYQAALQLNPEDFKSAYNLSLLYYDAGLFSKAIATIQSAIRSAPDSAEAFCTLGMFYLEIERLDESLICLDQSLAIQPEMAEAHFNKGIVLQKTGDYEHGLKQYRSAIECNPAFARAQWLYHLSLPMIYDHPNQIERYRQRFRLKLGQLIASTPLDSDDQIAYALSGVGSTTNFFLQYQGRNDLDLQTRYGHFVHGIIAANFPQWAKKKQMPALRPGQKIRIGYVSTFMYNHTIGSFLSGWLESHTSSDFEIHCYHMGKKVDALTHQLQQLSDRFRHFPGDVKSAARKIDRDDLHILVYTDIGMDPVTTQLAAMRLAPVQCKGWGHPITTGLPTIDYYLSSDLMEPEHADAFYSESLVRLPNLALCYRPPPIPKHLKTRLEMGIPNDRFVFLSTQSIFKYLPQHDDIYPRIALAVPRAIFIFISHQSSAATEKFRTRLRSAFSSFGLDADRHCHFNKRLGFNAFLNLNLVSDVLLDSMDWSGGKTTLEAITCNLPVVTLPGRFMRGRHAYAMLRMMGVLETVAENKSDYCDIAIRLANDPTFLAETKTRMAQNRHKLYLDRTFMTFLESFFHTVATKKHPSIPIPLTGSSNR